MSGKGIVFKCAFGGEDGWGHVIRCSALAAVFRERGWKTCLWTRSPVSGLLDEARERFDRVELDFFNAPDVEAFSVLVVDEMYTAETVLARLAERWARVRGGRPSCLLGIDDMQQRKMRGFDLVVNTEIGMRENVYASEQVLLGERYAMLRPAFQYAEDLSKRSERDSAERVFVMLGGTDPYGYTERVLRSLFEWNESVAPVVICGARGRPLVGVNEQLRRFPDGIMLESARAEVVAAWMGRSRLGVIACGSSLYEAAALRMPFIGLSLVDNQKATAEKVGECWGMPVLHREERHDDPLELKPALDTLWTDERSCYSQVDGLGCQRISEAVERTLRD